MAEDEEAPRGSRGNIYKYLLGGIALLLMGLLTVFIPLVWGSIDSRMKTLEANDAQKVSMERYLADLADIKSVLKEIKDAQKDASDALYQHELNTARRWAGKPVKPLAKRR